MTTIYTYKNISFKKRDYETANVIFCQSEYSTAPNANYMPCEEIELIKMRCEQVWIDSGYKYFGFL